MQRRGVLLSMDLPERERGKKKEWERVNRRGGGIKNGVVGLIMYTGQP